MVKTVDKTFRIYLENICEDDVEKWRKFLQYFAELGHFCNVNIEEPKDWE